MILCLLFVPNSGKTKTYWPRKDRDAGIYVEYYDKLDKLHRVLTVQDLQKVQGYWTVMKMEMKNVQSGHSTQITVTGPKYDIAVDKSLFTVAKLEKGL